LRLANMVCYFSAVPDVVLRRWGLQGAVPIL
jgi:hypothetical protein